jgi:hypothetical protein
MKGRYRGLTQGTSPVFARGTEENRTKDSVPCSRFAPGTPQIQEEVLLLRPTRWMYDTVCPFYPVSAWKLLWELYSIQSLYLPGIQNSFFFHAVQLTVFNRKCTKISKF